MGKIPPISLKLNFTPNTSGCWNNKNCCFSTLTQNVILCFIWVQNFVYITKINNMQTCMLSAMCLASQLLRSALKRLNARECNSSYVLIGGVIVKSTNSPWPSLASRRFRSGRHTLHKAFPESNLHIPGSPAKRAPGPSSPHTWCCQHNKTNVVILATSFLSPAITINL